MVSSNPEFLGDFVSAILSSSISFNRSDFGLLLESLNLSSTAIIRSFVGNRPKFSWTPGGTNVPENGITFSLAFDKFDLVIYDANQSAVISKNNLTSATCILSLSETNLLSLAYGSYYFVAVKAYDSFEVLSGGYPCHWYQFSK